MATIPIARRVSIARAAPILAGCAAAVLHIGCAAGDEGPRAAARDDRGEITRIPQPVLTASVSEADVAAVRLARWRIWDQLAAGLPDGYLLSIELVDPPTGPAFAVVTLVTDHRAVQNVVGVPLSAVTTAAMTASGDPASPEVVAIGEPPPKQPPDPGIVALGNALLTAAFHDNAPASHQIDGPAPPSSIAPRDPSPAQAPQPGFGVGESPPKEDTHPGFGVDEPPPEEDTHPGSGASARRAQQRTPSGVAIGEPPPKEPPQPGVAVPAATSQALVDRVRIARWQVWNQRAAALPDGHVLSVELLHARPGQAFAVVTRAQDHRAVRSVVGAVAAITGTEDPAAPDMIALGDPPPKQPPEPGVIAKGASLLTIAFAGDAAEATSPGR